MFCDISPATYGETKMALQPVYLVATKNLPKFLDAIRHAQTPEKLSLKFIEDLGFTSTNDRLFVPLLKALRFVDESAKPTARYHAFLDDAEWKRVLAQGIRDAFPDLFRVNRNAHQMSREQLPGKIKSLAEGKLSDAVLGNTVRTFLELVKIADFSEADAPNGTPPVPEIQSVQAPAVVPTGTSKAGHTAIAGLSYRIEIVLPAVRDQSVYDAIFRSVREHLLD